MTTSISSADQGFNFAKAVFNRGKRMRYPTVVVRGDVLASWLTVSDYTRTQLARELEVSKGRVSQLLTSREEPSAHLIAKLMTITRLPFDRLFKILREEALSTADLQRETKVQGTRATAEEAAV